MAEKPYYEPHYLELIKQAREQHLGNIQATSAAIINLYREAADDLADRAAAARKGSLTERWADEYAQSLAKRAAELEAGLYDVILQGLKRSAELPAIAMGQWWEAVGGQSFRDAFAMPQDNVLAGIIEGGFYKDNQGLSRRIWRLADSFEKDIGYIVQRGIAEKKSALELARDLEQYVKPPAAREWDWGKVYPNLSGKKVDYNAQRLARTAINHAYFLDNVRVCTENPFVTAMHWDLSNAHDERQVIPFGPDECDDYAEHDEGLGEGNFKPDELPCPHPQCLCAQWAVIPESLEDIGRQIGAWASGEPDERLDEWYDKYGSRNPNGDPKEIVREGLQSRSNSGRMYKDSKAVYFPVTQQAINCVPHIKISDDEIFNENYRKACQNLLQAIMNSGAEAGTEFSAVFNMAMQQIGEYRIGGIGHVKIDNPDELYHALHNHGSGNTLSFSDVANFVTRENEMSITAVGNNGSVYGLFMTADVDRDGYSNYLREKAKDIIYSANDVDFSLNTVEQIARGEIEKPSLTEEQDDRLKAAILSITDEVLKSGEKYGFQYIETPPTVAD